MDRRELLKAAPALPVAVVSGGATGALFTCTPTGGIQIDPNILVAINNAAAQGCNFIPAITTVIGIINATFPAVLGATTIAQSVITEISSMICANKPPPVAGKLGAAAKTITVRDKEIPVNGWVVIDGKLQYV